MTIDECRMSNVEGRHSVYFIKRTEQSETILDVDVGRSIFSLFSPSCRLYEQEAGQA